LVHNPIHTTIGTSGNPLNICHRTAVSHPYEQAKD
jgi:hypothetical protein